MTRGEAILSAKREPDVELSISWTLNRTYLLNEQLKTAEEIDAFLANPDVWMALHVFKCHPADIEQYRKEGMQRPRCCAQAENGLRCTFLVHGSSAEFESWLQHQSGYCRRHGGSFL